METSMDFSPLAHLRGGHCRGREGHEGDHHRLVHPEGGHQELGRLGQVDHQGEDEGCHREEGSYPAGIGNL